MSADSEQLDDVKATLMMLQTQFGALKNADVEIALAYYYVYANDYTNALTQIDLVATEFKALKKDSIKKFRLIQLNEMKVAILEEQAKMKIKSKMEAKK